MTLLARRAPATAKARTRPGRGRGPEEDPPPAPAAGPDIVLGRFPEELRAHAALLPFAEGDCLFCSRTDLHLDGGGGEGWLLAGRSALAVAWPGRSGPPALTGPFPLAQIEKVRCTQTVGSGFLQVMVDGVYVDVIRFSNRKREVFGRSARIVRRLIESEPPREEDLARPSDRACGTCGLPLAGRGAQCPRCQGGRGIMARTLKLLHPYMRSILFLLLVMVAGVCLDLLPPLLTKILVDDVLNPEPARRMAPLEFAGLAFNWLPLILLGLVAASAVRHGLNIIIGRNTSIIGTRITKELRERLQEKLMGLGVEYYNRHSVGSLMSRVLYDVDYFQGFVTQVAQGFLLNLMLVLGIGIMLFAMNWRLALLVLLPIPLVAVGTVFFWRCIYPRYYRLWDSQSKMSQMMSGLLGGIRLVKIFGQEAREQKRFGESAANMQEARRSLEISMAVFNPIMGFVFGLGGLLIWYAGGHMVLGDVPFLGPPISLGTLMAFFGYLGMFYAPVSSLSMFSSWVSGFLSAGQRVFEVLDSNAALPADPDPVRLPRLGGAIELRNVTFGYDPYTPVLKNVSLSIAPGQFVGIVGKSGSGKTTLVNLICRFYDTHEGDVLIDGVNVRHIAGEDLHRQVGLVLQEPFLFRASIAENIAYGRPEAGPLEIMDAAHAANAHDFIARRAGGYDDQLGENGAGLSGGERQRISIARALLCDPRILILDEATSSVDTESEQEIQKALARLCRGRTTLAIAHRLSTLKNADHIYVFDQGRVAEEGSHDELMERGGIYHKLVKIQTELTRLPS